MSRARDLADSADLAFDGDTLKIDSTNNRVGIGTTSPSTQLEIKSAEFTDSQITLDNTSSNTSSRVLFKAAGTEYGRITGDYTQVALQSANIPLAFRTNGSERMRIDSSGNVGIGTDSPSDLLHVYGGSLRLQGSGDGAYAKAYASGGDLYLLSDAGNNGGASKTVFGVDGTERMRIDTSGNLLVGTTSTSIGSSSGGYLAASGFAAHTRDGGTVADFNRLTSDGSIVNFRKDGTTVGSIGVENSAIPYFVDDANGGLAIINGKLCPSNTSGAAADATFDLGQGNRRFKNLYLSGGVYLGGTGSANYLDDYEEGNFNPILKDSSGNTFTGSYSAQMGYYRKIGAVVYFSIKVQPNGSVTSNGLTSGSTIEVHDLPYVTVGTQIQHIFTVEFSGAAFTGYDYVTGFVQNNGSDYLRFRKIVNNGVWTNMSCSDFSNAQAQMSGFYFTST